MKTRKNKENFDFRPKETQPDPIAVRLILIVFLIVLGLIVLFGCKRRGQAGETPGGSALPSAETPRETEGSASISPVPSPPPRFAVGTFVLGRDIGTLTLEEAKTALSAEEKALKESWSFTFRSDGESYSVDGRELTLGTDLGHVLPEALENGAGRYEIKVIPADDEKLMRVIGRLASEANREPAEPELLPIELAAPVQIAAGNANERFVVTAAEDGARVDIAEAKRLLLSGETEAELPLIAVPASAAAPELPVRRAVFSTSFAGSGLGGQGRIANIKKAAGLIDGSILQPGQSLSCNAALGERTAEAGWQRATAFANGGRETEQQYGGGICQVSTTLYNCALLAGLDVPERQGHSRRVNYIEGGLDAALSWGGADLVIRNSTSAPIHIFMWADEAEKAVHCEIYGAALPSGYDGISLVSELIRRIEPGEPEFEPDPTLSPGECVLIRSAITGSLYRSYRVFWKDGAELWREPLAETAYAMHPALYAVGAETEGSGNDG
ncbi:MAG: VanW family protein [Clostridia bacterium]|nr:VanW family protein [Clostridia bacterium]